MLYLKIKRGQLIILVLSIILLGISIYILRGVFWTGDLTSNNHSAKSALNSTSSFKDLQTNGSISLASEDINKLLALYVPKPGNISSLKVESLRSNIKDNKLAFLGQINFYGVKLLFSTKGKLEYKNNIISYAPDYFKLGQLTLPKSLVYSQLKKYLVINAEKNRIEIASSNFPINIESLAINDDMLNIKLGLNQITPDPPKKKEDNKNESTPQSSTESAESENPKKPNVTSNNPNNVSKKPSSSTNTIIANNPTDTRSTNSPVNDLLTRANSDLSKVYSSVKTANEKQLVEAVQSILQKVLKDENYPYEKHAAEIKSKYDKLTSSEKADLENIVLNEMDLNNLLKVWDVFNEK